MSRKPRYHSIILNVDLSTGKIEKLAVPSEDLDKFVGGQGLGMKILWDRLKKPGSTPFLRRTLSCSCRGRFRGCRSLLRPEPAW